MSAGCEVKPSSSGEQRVACGFKIQAPLVHPPKELIGRIESYGSLIVVAALLIDARKHDQPMEFLERPAFVHESRGKVVEQLRMRRRIGANAEIARGADEARAEMSQPDAVHQHARRQRIVFACDGLGEFQPAAALLKRLPLVAGKEFPKLPP